MRPLESPSWERIERAFEKWDTLSRGFFTLIDASGSYVQTAGASYKAIVEFRATQPGGAFTHYILGHPGGSTKPTAIYTSIGTLHLNENEIFALPEILEIFRSFYDHRTVPVRFSRREDMGRFTA